METYTMADLSEYSEIDLITALYEKGIDLHYIEGAYYALDEQWGHRMDEAMGYSEDGRHGKNSDKKVSVHDVAIPKQPKSSDVETA